MLMQKMGLESDAYSVYFFKITAKISIIFQKARGNDAYEKSEILEYFAKHHDAYKKMSVSRHQTRQPKGENL